MRPLDTVRLEVLTNGNKELFASPGDRKFSEDHPGKYVGSGALADGIFGPYLKEILLSDEISSLYKGEEQSGARRLARYEYRIPLLISGQLIQTPEGSGRVGLRGSFWVDTATYDVVRLQLNADEFPPTLPVSEMTIAIDYGRILLPSGSAILLPQTAELRLVKYSGEADLDRIDFTQCRVFEAESTISFDAPNSAEQNPRFASASIDDTLRRLPGGLHIAVKLLSAVSANSAVGSLIDGVVAQDVVAKRAVIIPAGSMVRGRIRRLERYSDPSPVFVVGLEFTEVEVRGIRHVFDADLVSMDNVAGVEPVLPTKDTTATMVDSSVFGQIGWTSQHSTEYLWLPDLPGVASFFFKGSRLELPPNFRTVWKTRLLKQ
jgi:hypothetical protein